MKGWLASILMYALICVIGLALLIIQGYSIWSWKFFCRTTIRHPYVTSCIRLQLLAI